MQLSSPHPRSSLKSMARAGALHVPRASPSFTAKDALLAQRQTCRKANSGLGIRVRTLYHDRYSASGSLQISKPHRHVALQGKAPGCSWGGMGKPTRHRVLKQALEMLAANQMCRIPESLCNRKEVLPGPYLFNLSHGKENLHLLCSYLTT